jgi:two-component system, NarL family, invasion response regulator UvrY
LRILLVDKHPLIANGFAALISPYEGWELKSASTVEAGAELLRSFAPDIAVLDFDLGGGSGLELLQLATSWPSQTRCIIFTSGNDPVIAGIALEAGAKAFVSKSDDPERLIEAIEVISEGGTWLPPCLVQDVARLRTSIDGRNRGLSDREFEVLRSLAHGETMGEMAFRLGVSYRTVSNDCAILREKLDAKSLPELIRIAMSRKIL